MANSQLNSHKSLKSGRLITSTATGAIFAKGVDMILQSGRQRLQVLRDIDLEVQKGDIQL